MCVHTSGSMSTPDPQAAGLKAACKSETHLSGHVRRIRPAAGAGPSVGEQHQPSRPMDDEFRV